MTQPSLVITMGDPAGIGPEIVAKAFAAGKAPDCVVAGSPSVMKRAVQLVGADLEIRKITSIEEGSPEPGVINVLPISQDAECVPFGKVSAAGGRAAFEAVIAAIDLAKTGRASGIVTAPINKEALSAAGLSYPGHTEILAECAGVDRVAMMLANDEIRTVLVTIHQSLSDAIKSADFSAQMNAIRLAQSACLDLGIAAPRIAVAGLNPHAGEGGLFGREEIEIISPAIDAARAEGIDVTGPWPGDTVFMAARRGKFDVVVAQYHDQGLIPVKYLGVETGVNITLGLPFVRTSPDHGTAFDIAGQGVADAASLSTAIAYAHRLAATRRTSEEAA